MSRLTLLALQLLVAIVGLVLWQVFTTVPVFGEWTIAAPMPSAIIT